MFYWQFMRNKMLKTVGRDITITSTTLPFTILRAKGGNLINYTISGNSTQNGTPTPTDPIAIQSVGNSILPSRYTQVEYLEAVGTGTGAVNIYHIDTGIACSLDMEVETNIKHISTDSNLLTPYAIDRNQGATGIGLSHYSGSVPAWAVKFGSDWANKGIIVKDTWYNIVHNKDKFILNGTSSSLTNSDTLTSNLYIMTGIWSSTIRSTTKLQMKNFIIRKSGTVVFNGIACKDNSTNKYGMYDTISGSFFGNGGSGTFTAGPVASEVNIPVVVSTNSAYAGLPSGYTQVEWIKSDGSAYLQTTLTSYKNIYTYKIGVKRYDTTTKFMAFQNPAENLDTIGMFAYGTGFYVQNGVKYPQRVSISVDTNSFHDIVIESNGCSVDGTKTRFTPASEFTVSQSLYVFAGANPLTGDVDYRISTNALSYFEIYDENNNLVLNLIPAKNSSNEYGMYDLVSNTFFTNAGSGAFTAGPEITGTTTNITLSEPLRAISPSVELPSKYEQLDYIQSSGTQWIDTGIQCKSTHGFHIKAQYTSLTNEACIISASSGSTHNVIQYYNGSLNFYMGAGIHSYSKGGILTNTILEVELNKNLPTIADCYVNGTQLTLGSGESSVFANINYNWWLFSRNISGTVGVKASEKMWFCKIYDDGELVRNMIPARRKSDSVVGMYDTVSREFFTNAGTGTFIAGERVIDKLDFTTQQVTRKCGEIASYNGETITGQWISSTGQLSTGAQVVYELASPTTTSVTLPTISVSEGTNIIDVQTTVKPSEVSVKYKQ